MNWRRAALACLYSFGLVTGLQAGRSFVPGALSAGSAQGSSQDNLVKATASSTFGANPSYFGVEGGTNPAALDDLDGLLPAEEWLEFQFAPEVGLSALEYAWTRGNLLLTGFVEDPQASEGLYDEENGSWSYYQAWEGATRSTIRFSNWEASQGQTLRLTIQDPSLALPQVALTSLEYEGTDLGILSLALLPDFDQPAQTVKNFGASMLWTIDPTEDWPERVKEELALKLMSQAGGIGLSGLRFDFGGGNLDTGTRVNEPFTWRFPEPLKDSASDPFDWSRREGQQWMLRRSRDLAVSSHTLASISPPWWMTKNGLSYCGPSSGTTNITTDKMADYAAYLADVIEHFKVSENVAFDLVSPINEPEYPWDDGGQEGNRGTAEDIREMVLALHSELASRGLDETRIEVGDHAMVNALLDDSVHTTYSGGIWNQVNNQTLGKFREYLADLTSHPDMVDKISPVSSYHSYFSDSLTQLHSPLRAFLEQNAANRGVGVAQTEYCILGSYGPGRDLGMEPARRIFRTIHKDLSVANAVAWNWWLALSPHDFKDGLIYTDFDSVTDTNPRLFDSKIFWTLGHFSRFIRPGWVRLEGSDFQNLNGVMSTAWLSPDQKEIVFVVANLSPDEVNAELPTMFSGVSGSVREWVPWVTDRGRSLRREASVVDSFLIAPQSITTLVGRLSESRFQLVTYLEAADWSVASGETISVQAGTTWEDGRYLIPALDASEYWIFESPIHEASGRLTAGRYHIRRESDGHYLGLVPGAEIPRATSIDAEEGALWEVFELEGGQLQLCEVASQLWLSGKGKAIPERSAKLAAQRVDLEADYRWADGLGEESQASFQAVASRWVEVESRFEGELARSRAKVRVDSPLFEFGGLPERLVLSPGESAELAPSFTDPGQPLVFRIVPEVGDLVLLAKNGGLELLQAKGDDDENWVMVPPGGGLPLSGVSNDGSFWLQASGGDYLKPAAESPSPGEGLVLGAGEAGACEWSLEENGFCYRLRHEASGLYLAVQDGEVALAPFEESSCYYFDPLIDEPMTIRWTDGEVSSLGREISPSTSSRLEVTASKAGVTQTQTVEIVVKQSFAEWSRRWFGQEVSATADHDGDDSSALLEYAAGTNPLDFDSKPEVGVSLVGSQFEVSYAKNEEAEGEWIIEQSGNLISWDPAPNVSEDLTSISGLLSSGEATRRFVRLRFIAGFSEEGAQD